MRVSFISHGILYPWARGSGLGQISVPCHAESVLPCCCRVVIWEGPAIKADHISLNNTLSGHQQSDGRMHCCQRCDLILVWYPPDTLHHEFCFSAYAGAIFAYAGVCVTVLKLFAYAGNVVYRGDRDKVSYRQDVLGFKSLANMPQSSAAEGTTLP